MVLTLNHAESQLLFYEAALNKQKIIFLGVLCLQFRKQMVMRCQMPLANTLQLYQFCSHNEVLISMFQLFSEVC